ncbi:MAG: hypothetical protein U1E77_09140 [Inhella sp.]
MKYEIEIIDAQALKKIEADFSVCERISCLISIAKMRCQLPKGFVRDQEANSYLLKLPRLVHERDQNYLFAFGGAAFLVTCGMSNKGEGLVRPTISMDSANFSRLQSALVEAISIHKGRISEKDGILVATEQYWQPKEFSRGPSDGSRPGYFYKPCA